MPVKTAFGVMAPEQRECPIAVSIADESHA